MTKLAKGRILQTLLLLFQVDAYVIGTTNSLLFQNHYYQVCLPVEHLGTCQCPLQTHTSSLDSDWQASSTGTETEQYVYKNKLINPQTPRYNSAFMQYVSYLNLVLQRLHVADNLIQHHGFSCNLYMYACTQFMNQSQEDSIWMTRPPLKVLVTLSQPGTRLCSNSIFSLIFSLLTYITQKKKGFVILGYHSFFLIMMKLYMINHIQVRQK